MALVVCQFDNLANEYRPIRRLRNPPNVPKNPAVSSIGDWKDYRYPEIGQQSDYIYGNIDQHLVSKVGASHGKTNAQYSAPSVEQGKYVDKWISSGDDQRSFPPEDNLQVPPEIFPAPGGANMSDASAGATSVSVPQDLKPTSSSRPQSTDGPRYMVIQPGGKLVPASQARREDINRMKKTPRYLNIINLPESYQTTKVSKEQAASSSVVATPRQNKPPVILPCGSDSQLPGNLSGTTASDTSTFDQRQKLTSTPRRPIRPSSAKVNSTQLVNIPKAVSSQVNTRPQGEKRVDSVIRELGLMIEKAKLASQSEREIIPRMQGSDQKQSSREDGRLGLTADEVKDISPLIDLDCEVSSSETVLKQISAFKPLVPVSKDVPSQSAGSQHDRPKAPTGSNADDIFDLPNVEDMTGQARLAVSNVLSFEQILDSNVLRTPTPTPVDELAADSPLRTQSEVLSPIPERDKLTGGPDQKSGKSTENSRNVAMEFLRRHIKEAFGPETFDTRKITSQSGDGCDDLAPRDLPARSNDSAPCVAHQRQASHRDKENVPALRADLIDISPQSLSSHLSRRSLQQTDPKNGDQDMPPGVCEALAATDETQTREFHKTMFHRHTSETGSPPPNAESEAKKMADSKIANTNPWTRRTKSSMTETEKQRTDAVTADHQEKKMKPKSTGSKSAGPKVAEKQLQSGTALPTRASVKSAKKKSIDGALRNLFRLLGPVLDAVRSFPGTSSLEILFGLMFMPSLPASTKEREMSYKEVYQLFFPVHTLAPPPVSMFDRLTSSPADIDYLINLQINRSRLFEPSYSYRSVKYEFWGHTGTDRAIVVSVNEDGHATIYHPQVILGTVHLSFPSQIWDAAARVQGSIGYTTGTDPELFEAIQAMVQSIRIEPDQQQLRMLVRVPPTSKIRIDQVVMERQSRHAYQSDKSKDLFLQITETQELSITPSAMDSGIMVVQNASLEKMVERGKQWWQASIGSSKIEAIMKSNEGLKPGDRNESWCPTDLLGADIANYVPPTADQELSALGAEVGYSGIGAMLQLAKTIVENIDAIGYWNIGPAARSLSRPSVTSGGPSVVGQSTTTSREQPEDWRTRALVPWGAAAKGKPKRKW